MVSEPLLQKLNWKTTESFLFHDADSWDFVLGGRSCYAFRCVQAPSTGMLSEICSVENICYKVDMIDKLEAKI